VSGRPGDQTPFTAADGDHTPRETLRLPRCRECQRCFWYPRSRCPHCWSADIEQVESLGTGTLYTYSTLPPDTKQPGSATDDRILAYVQLDEGPFVLTSVVGLSPHELRIGMPLTAVPADGEQPVRFAAPAHDEAQPPR